uniref:Uncharacterized protein n=1 Tax=Pipistrellus kuhlii TaxID=59472 RepID=A0A7J7T0U0_PIPKU|nr:hypothetical protein mPipKuh1_009732 [Pipistrellus kuhlii]
MGPTCSAWPSPCLTASDGGGGACGACLCSDHRMEVRGPGEVFLESHCDARPSCGNHSPPQRPEGLPHTGTGLAQATWPPFLWLPSRGGSGAWVWAEVAGNARNAAAGTEAPIPIPRGREL